MTSVTSAAQAIAAADAVLITAGAGMGVDSGLPDFRGTQGFWRAYPHYERLGLDFASLANPRWFQSDPTLAWGFYGHRMELYRRTQPHPGFEILRQWCRQRKHGGFVFTSNVDGQFQRAGFDADRIVQIHGGFDGMQCLRDCGIGIFAGEPFTVDVDPETMRAIPPLPACPRCGKLARPNILMFGDFGWDATRTDQQQRRMISWLGSIVGARLVIIECGAGEAIPTVRNTSHNVARAHHGALLVRINPREPNVPRGHVSIDQGALAALRAIDEQLSARNT